ncbi:hypothetical protein Ctha_2123 [Chloroherpeton thalassium ATCC 35110]|uniref:Uncharacterized protein n=1 Tax=Chloroherpeton thalassium (strain ATCC 35110 / GB-78) TaxID=517418 RepID=B3QVH5_CHLT3|nr:hypothetical protein [Chloroherpeton thalassium]ACF14575.1 hypothetical protein Ctha_2123 [Chloroherpeton thalassium ATCC 35110]
MNQGTSDQTPNSRNVEPLDDFIYRSMKTLGWLADTSESRLNSDDEQSQKEDFALPAALQSFSSVQSKIYARKQSSQAAETVATSPETLLQFSRAARLGKHISEEIEQKMKKDKRLSQHQNKSGYDDLFD